MSTGVTKEIMARVYDDQHDLYVQVGPDADGLGLCAIEYHEGDDVRGFTISWRFAEKLAEAILEVSKANEDHQ